MKVCAVSEDDNFSPSVPAIGSFWACYLKASLGIVSELTPKQFGQLKRLRTLFGSVTCPLISRTIDNWSRFAVQTKWSAGLPSAPATPHIGFLLAHCDVAVNLMHQIAKNANPKDVGDLSFIVQVDELIARSQEKLRAEIEQWESCEWTKSITGFTAD